MQRILMQNLEVIGGKLTLAGTPFSGVGYDLESGVVVANHHIVEGKPMGAFEDWDEATARVTPEALVEREPNGEIDDGFDGERFHLGDSVFSGILYEFDDEGFLVSEVEYKDSVPGHGLEWYSSGDLGADRRRVRKDCGIETETWHENHQRHSLETPRLSATFTKDGRLRTLVLERGFDLKDLNRVVLCADHSLTLAGSAVNDEILSHLSNLQEISDLTLDGTAISSEGLRLFEECKELVMLDTARNPGFNVADVHQLLENVPNCKWLDRDQMMDHLRASKPDG